MLTEYLHEHTRAVDHELRELAHSRPRYDRPADRRPRVRGLIRTLTLSPAKAVVRGGALPDVVIRPAAVADTAAVARLAEASERRLPSGSVLVAEVETELIAALTVDDRVLLTDLWRPTGDVVQLLELRAGQLRAAGLDGPPFATAA